MLRRFLLCLPGLALAALPIPARAQGRPLLRMTGRLDPSLSPAGVSYDLAGFEALGATDLVTRTPWTRGGPIRFTGVPLTRLLASVGARGEMLRVQALNDYAVNVPAEDARLGAFLATRQDGRPLRIRDLGPLWLIYPWSSRPELDSGVYRERSVWQLTAIEVL